MLENNYFNQREDNQINIILRILAGVPGASHISGLDACVTSLVIDCEVRTHSLE